MVSKQKKTEEHCAMNGVVFKPVFKSAFIVITQWMRTFKNSAVFEISRLVAIMQLTQFRKENLTLVPWKL